ncbi:hypothetical protein ANANG_G00046730 [Anguilla anguilla]|uniref:GLTSCR protein conserved domain-containing protein n=1 Tax=Anguilla anguilla TaxID=7936 RepID=A0A9D3MUZ7_ANGAN|nr:hypothetical protein ANANG_G00046730 [Anguilla anguilla]
MGGVAKVWPGGAVQNRFTLVSSAGAQALEGGATGPQGQQQVSVSLVPLTQDPVPATNAAAESYAFSSSQDTSSAAQFINLPGNKILKTVTPISQVDSTSTTNTQLGSQKRPAPQQLTKGILVLQQLRRDQAKVLAADRLPFSSLEDAAHQLLPYHVYQGALPSNEDFKTVDEEFETAATHVLKRTQSMLNKYRRLLLVEAERTNPSSELVMIDRTFNQEERSNLTRDKRLALVDPEGFLEDFCCLAKPEGVRSAGPETGPVGVTGLQGASSFPPRTEHHHGDMKDLGSVQADENGRGSADPSYRTEPQPGCKDPGWEGPEVSLSEHLETAIKNILDLKKTRRGSYVSHAPSATPSSVPHQALFPPQRQGPEKPLPSEHSQPPTVAHTDSVLEAAVNSILEC